MDILKQIKSLTVDVITGLLFTVTITGVLCKVLHPFKETVA
ncbi:hypothetical protein [Polaribacter filamentus]|nr:hypothetical protein [Polaribacter filamentus]